MEWYNKDLWPSKRVFWLFSNFSLLFSWQNTQFYHSMLEIIQFSGFPHPISLALEDICQNGGCWKQWAWTLFDFHNTSVDNLWHTFQLPLGKILAYKGIQNRLICNTKIWDVSRYFDDISRYLEFWGGYLDIFLRISEKIFRRFCVIFV